MATIRQQIEKYNRNMERAHASTGPAFLWLYDPETVPNPDAELPDLADAIERGHPAFGPLKNKLFWKIGGKAHACALGQALLCAGLPARPKVGQALGALWPDLDCLVPPDLIPYAEGCPATSRSLRTVIENLNDVLEWDRVAIAAWVRRVVPHLEAGMYERRVLEAGGEWEA